VRGVEEGIDCLRRAVGTLHPVTIEHDGLAGALAALAAEAERRGGFQCDLHVDEEAGGRCDHVLVSLARELLTNAAKHSGAVRVAVSVSRDRDWLRLDVSDDGRGFDASGRHRATCDGHIGLAAAERRARALGGSLAITTGPGQGTEASVRLPADVGRIGLAAGNGRR
jgi:two-component system NarL family sensor kinase